MLDDALVVWTGEFGRTPLPRVRTVEIITLVSPPGLQAVESNTVLPLEPPMNLGTRRWKTVMKFMTCMLPCYIYLASSTRKVLFASVGVTCV